MKYLDLFNSNNLFDSDCLEAGREFWIKRYLDRPTYFFIKFQQDGPSASERKSLDANWKARISIHPDDFVRAWDVFSPLLFKTSSVFKVVDTKKLSEIRQFQKEKWDALLEIGHSCLGGQNAASITALRGAGFRMFDLLTPAPYSGFFRKLKYYFMRFFNYLSLSFTPTRYVYSYVNSQHERLVSKYNYDNTQQQRFSDGMQVTIYMCPGTEQVHRRMLKKIEHGLSLEGIRPGEIYSTDRPLGKYVSIRHPGKTTYHDAVTVDSYNPDNVEDPFAQIATPSPSTNDLHPRGLNKSKSSDGFCASDEPTPVTRSHFADESTVRGTFSI